MYNPTFTYSSLIPGEQLRKAALLLSVSDYAESWRQGLAASLPAEAIVMTHEISGDLSDFKPLILQLRSRQVQSLGLCLNPGLAGILGRQLREMKLELPIFGCYFLSDSQEAQAAQGALRGAWFPTIPVTAEFRRRYVEKHHNDTLIAAAANYYDTARLLHELEPGRQGPAIIAALLKVRKFPGAVGSFDIVERDGDRYFDIPLIIDAIK